VGLPQKFPRAFFPVKTGVKKEGALKKKKWPGNPGKFKKIRGKTKGGPLRKTIEIKGT